MPQAKKLMIRSTSISSDETASTSVCLAAPRSPTSPASTSFMSSSCSGFASSKNVTRNVHELDTPAAPPCKKFRAGFSVKELLLAHPVDGKQIVEELEEEKLSRRSRLQMVRILVAYMIEKFGDRPKSDVKASLAKAVITEFPFLKDNEGGEGYEAWYTPGSGLHSSTGWLEERLRNVRRKLNETSPKGAKLSKVIKNKPQCSFPESNITEEEFQGKKEWLKYHTEPLQKVKEFMEQTAIKRVEYIRSSGESLQKVITEFPRLFDIEGMVEQDFNTVYPEYADRLFLQWTSSFSERTLGYADLQGGTWLRSLQLLNRNALDTDEKKLNISLQVLPTILPPGRKGKQKSSVMDALRSFIDVQPIGTNIPKYLEEVSLTQPYILILGDRPMPSQAFTIFERKAMERQSLMSAVDVCFKLFFLLDLNYPWQSATTWEFLQKVVYGLSGDKGKTNPAVRDMRVALTVSHN